MHEASRQDKQEPRRSPDCDRCRCADAGFGPAVPRHGPLRHFAGRRVHRVDSGRVRQRTHQPRRATIRLGREAVGPAAVGRALTQRFPRPRWNSSSRSATTGPPHLRWRSRLRHRLDPMVGPRVKDRVRAGASSSAAAAQSSPAFATRSLVRTMVGLASSCRCCSVRSCSRGSRTSSGAG